MKANHLLIPLLVALSGAAIVPGARAQEGDPPPEEGVLPSLDEALGLEEEEEEEGEGAPEREEIEPAAPGEADLERRLSAEEAAEQFEQALQLMRDAAGRLESARDTGIRTQRIQEDVIRRLEMLIRTSEQQQNPSSSGGSGQQQQQAQDPGQQQAQPQRQGRAQQGSRPTPAGGGGDVPLQQGDLAAQPASGSTWGNLPERVRDAVVQSQTEKFSALYRALTEAYYRRLAEEQPDQ